MAAPIRADAPPSGSDREPSLDVAAPGAGARPPGRTTLGGVIARNDGRTYGFDYLRLGLALAVVLVHSISTSYGPRAGNFVFEGWLRPLTVSILPAFFALSGFLVCGSLARNPSLFAFLMLRAIRIVPALAAETILCAVVLGPAMTALSLWQYFSDPIFYKYFLNIIGVIQFYLPGVFVDNPFPRVVNGQLWTVPVELECYVALALIFIFGLFTRMWLLVPLFLAGTVYALASQYTRPGIALEVANVHQRVLLLSFLAGVILYQLRDRVPYSLPLVLCAGLASYALLLGTGTSYFVPLPIAYLVAGLGVLEIPKRTFLLRGDYSYGIFLFGFPLQQTFAHLAAQGAPELQRWWINFLVCVPLSIGMAYLSWHLIEARVLARKRAIIEAVRGFIPFLGRGSGTPVPRREH